MHGLIGDFRNKRFCMSPLRNNHFRRICIVNPALAGQAFFHLLHIIGAGLHENGFCLSVFVRRKKNLSSILLFRFRMAGIIRINLKLNAGKIITVIFRGQIGSRRHLLHA